MVFIYSELIGSCVVLLTIRLRQLPSWIKFTSSFSFVSARYARVKAAFSPAIPILAA